jgi:CubicO group peptidase (beta-lactamase class C family)
MRLFKAFACTSTLLLSALAVTSTSLQVNAQPIDNFMKTTMQEKQIPGAQVAVIKGDKIVFKKSYGVIDIETKNAVTDTHLFQINSMTKAFTGVAIMQLVEAGKLQLDDSVGLHLPELPAPWKPLKIKHLLAHTSGLPMVLTGHLLDLIVLNDLEASWQKAQILPMRFKENTQFNYNQTGYMILGKIIDKYQPQGFQSFITKQQLTKVGMTKTASAGFDSSVQSNSQLAPQYFYNNQHHVFHAKYDLMLQTAAGMSSNAEELAKYLISLKSKKLIKDLNTLWTPVTLEDGNTRSIGPIETGYAMGWQVIEREHHPAVSASGGNAVSMVIYPEDDVAIVVLTNLIGANPILFADKIAAQYIPNFKL